MLEVETAAIPSEARIIPASFSTDPPNPESETKLFAVEVGFEITSEILLIVGRGATKGDGEDFFSGVKVGEGLDERIGDGEIKVGVAFAGKEVGGAGVGVGGIGVGVAEGLGLISDETVGVNVGVGIGADSTPALSDKTTPSR